MAEPASFREVLRLATIQRDNGRALHVAITEVANASGTHQYLTFTQFDTARGKVMASINVRSDEIRTIAGAVRDAAACFVDTFRPRPWHRPKAA